MGIEAAARSFGLDFVPLASERYELIVPARSPLLPEFLELISVGEFTRAVSALGGYDLKECGRVRSIR
ncbi:MAG: substrate-binding domain-containing protein, partial [Pseudoxanthomonas sp.]